MKACLLALLLLGAAPAAAQTAISASTPMPQANTIVVRTSDSLSVAFQKLTKVLLSSGYGLDKIEPSAAYLATSVHATSARPAVKVIVRMALFKEPGCTRIEVRGSYAVDGLPISPVINRGQRGSATAAAWQDLQRVGLLYPNGIVAYRREL